MLIFNFFSPGRLGIRLKMHGIYLRDKIRSCKAILVLLGKSRFFLKITSASILLGLSIPETYLQSVKTVKKTLEGQT